MIAAEIYNLAGFDNPGHDKENANLLGLPLLNYQSRRDTLLEFLQEHEFSEGAYLNWISEKTAEQNSAAVVDDEAWTVEMPSRGIGDDVAKITHRVGIKPCGGCKKRQAWLNKKFPTRGNK